MKSIFFRLVYIFSSSICLGKVIELQNHQLVCSYLTYCSFIREDSVIVEAILLMSNQNPYTNGLASTYVRLAPSSPTRTAAKCGTF